MHVHTYTACICMYVHTNTHIHTQMQFREKVQLLVKCVLPSRKHQPVSSAVNDLGFCFVSGGRRKSVLKVLPSRELRRSRRSVTFSLSPSQHSSGGVALPSTPYNRNSLGRHNTKVFITLSFYPEHVSFFLPMQFTYAVHRLTQIFILIIMILLKIRLLDTYCGLDFFQVKLTTSLEVSEACSK